MKRYSILLLFFSVQLFGQTHAALEIKHLTGDFYIYTTYKMYDQKPFPANGLYLVTKDGVLLIDSPWDRNQLNPLLDSIRIKHHKEVKMCIATHSHDDRTGCLDLLNDKGIATYTSKQTDQLSKRKEGKRASHVFEKDTLFTLGQYHFATFYPGKGHAEDNIIVWFENEKILYGGCFIKSNDATDLGNLNDANVLEWKVSLKKVMKKYGDARFVIPGHQSWKSTKSVIHTLKLIKNYLKKL